MNAMLATVVLARSPRAPMPAARLDENDDGERLRGGAAVGFDLFVDRGIERHRADEPLEKRVVGGERWPWILIMQEPAHVRAARSLHHGRDRRVQISGARRAAASVVLIRAGHVRV